MLKIKRIYEPYDENDGFRILVDRIYPRGVKKAEAHIDLWLKEVAPSAELRKWFNHEAEKWDDFQRRYAAELDAKQDLLAVILEAMRSDTVTLLYSARDEDHNQARALHAYILKLN